MALITDPDLLNQATEATINTSAKTITLAVAGNLSNDGVTLKALYSFLKEEWNSDPALIKFDFPMTPITDEQMQIGVSSRNNGWNWGDTTTRQLIRTGGWQEVNASGTTTAEYAGIVSLGSLEAGTQVYYQQSSGGAATNIVLTDEVNQAVKVYENGSFDYRSYFKLFAREQADRYASSDLSAIGVSTMTYQVYRFPLSTGADLKITTADADIIGETPYFAAAHITLSDGSVTGGAATFTSATGSFVVGDVGKFICIKSGANMGVYRIVTRDSATQVTVDRNFASTQSSIAFTANAAGMSITYHATPQARTVGASSYNFGIIIDGNNGTAEQIYEFVQYQLRQNNDIDADASSLVGKTADELLEFVGDTLKTKTATNPDGGGTGVFIDDYQTADVNRLVFKDNTGTERTFPFTAVLTINFNPTLVSDAASIYRVFFTNDDAGNNAGADFGTANAIIPRTSNNFTTVSRARSSNVATIVTSTAHGLLVGDVIELESMGGTGYNGVAVVASTPDSTTVTFANTGTNEGTTADTGGTLHQLMGGKVNGNSSLSLTYDYDTNDQRGAGSEAVDAPITVVAIGLSGAQYVLTTTTITRSNANIASPVASIERNYANA